MTATITLKPGRERSIRNAHPWIFSGAIAGQADDPGPGDAVNVCDQNGDLLGWGFYNTRSDIRVRLMETGNAAPGDLAPFLLARLKAAVGLREQHLDRDPLRAFRLVNSEGDGLSGLIVDVYAGHAVMQPLAVWVETHLETVVDCLKQAARSLIELKSLRLRVEEDAARHEGLTLENGPCPEGSDCPAEVQVISGRMKVLADLAQGQKTGLFLDQVYNHQLAARYAPGRDVLNLFAYTGGFSLHCAQAATQVTSLDSSAPAMQHLEQNAAINQIDAGEIIIGDVRRELPKLQQQNRRFGLIIADPPPFARKKDQIKKAARAYQDLNRRCFSLIDDGYLMTFSCSPFVDAKLFRQVIFAAAVEAKRQVQVLRLLGPGPDHPVSLYHPEGDYLNGLLLRVSTD